MAFDDARYTIEIQVEGAWKEQHRVRGWEVAVRTALDALSTQPAVRIKDGYGSLRATPGQLLEYSERRARREGKLGGRA